MNRIFEYITVEKTEDVATIILNRQPLNILNIAMLREINFALEWLASDHALRLLVITGRGKAFSAGVDVAEHLPDKAEEMLAVFQQTFDLLGTIESPIIAAINGAALGGGFEIAVFCDIVIAAESAKIGQPEIKLATLPPVAAVLFPRLCGLKRAMELLLTGETITAREAERIGLITRAVADTDLQREVEAMTKKLSSLSPAALRLTKRAILENADNHLHDGLRAADDICLDMLLNLGDSEEGLRAFLEKRPPRWRDL
ncbi:MAG: enoyl-CoA hydratase/isomerase family protein [Acidobacteriota bacterium]